MLNISVYNLNRNPFEYVFPSLDDNLVWAGMPTQKKDIKDIYENAFAGQGKRLVLNWGPYGGGKTHAAYYFGSKLNNIDIDKSKCIHIYSRLPREESPVRSFVGNVVEYIVYNNSFMERFNNLVKNRDSDFIEQNLSRILPSNISIVKSFLHIISRNSNELLIKYLYNTLSSQQLTKLNVSKPIKTDEDCIALLNIFLYILSLDEDKRIFLWIDEMENMIFYPAKKAKAFGDMIRDITDTVNKRMVTFFNFSLSDTSEDSVKALLGEALWRRLSNVKIRFKDLTYAEAMTYCVELVEYAQIDKNNKNTPFSSKLIEKVVHTIPLSELIPREINKRFDTILTYSMTHDIEEINVDVINRALSEINN